MTCSRLLFPSVEASPPGQGGPLSSLLPSSSVPESMTINELRQAIVAMMTRKDELEEENRSLRNLLDGEMEHSAALRQEVDALKKKVAEQEERHVTKVQALARENEVLKVQLKKYVGAVQMLKREGQTAEAVPNLWNVDGEVAVTEQKPGEVAEELASSYERKLIEVAEMHGELIEFNERLHRALVAKEALVSQMRQELIDLRGPHVQALPRSRSPMDATRKHWQGAEGSRFINLVLRNDFSCALREAFAALA